MTSAPCAALARRLAWTLGVMAASGPLAIDMYLPAFPRIAEDLDTALGAVQITLAVFLLGLAVGQILLGIFQFILGAVGGALVGTFHDGTAMPMAVQIACYALAARGILLLTPRRTGSEPLGRDDEPRGRDERGSRGPP